MLLHVVDRDDVELGFDERRLVDDDDIERAGVLGGDACTCVCDDAGG